LSLNFIKINDIQFYSKTKKNEIVKGNFTKKLKFIEQQILLFQCYLDEM